ncbi:MAG: HEAT repeat domain-containing protein [Planctomycetota bacterium]
MHRSITSVAALLAGLLLPGSLAKASPPPTQAVDVDALVREAMDGTDVDPGVFDAIGRERTREALAALVRCCERVRGDRQPAAYYALRHFAGQGELQARAIEFLSERSFGRDARSAVRALATFERAAQDELRRVLTESPDPLARQRAVGPLVDELRAYGTPEALQLLLDHYRVPFSGTATLGVKAFASFRRPECLEMLIDTLKSTRTDAGTRVLVASALGRRGDEATSAALVDALRDDDRRVVVAAIDALRERGEQDHLRRLVTLTRDRSPAVRAAAFHALFVERQGELAFERTVRRALAGRDHAVKVGLARGLADRPRLDTGTMLSELASDEDLAVRRAAVEAARSLRIASALPDLIECLDAGSDQLSTTARAALVELTGLDYGRTAGRWRAWWEGEGATYRLPSPEEARATAEERAARRADAPSRAEPTFYGVRLAGDRVTYVLDVSGSMSNVARLPRMVAETNASLDLLPPGSRFNLVFFSDAVRSWGKRLVSMTENNRRRASSALGSLVADGGTNLHGGLAAAFADPDVETIVLLSDGAPTVGETDQAAILRDVHSWNELRDVRVHTIAVGLVGADGLMEAIAAATEGEAIAVF